MREYSTVRGQRTAILLADGTRAVLSVESRLRVPATYGNRSRDVYLDGEGFFEVIHDSKMPFRVHTARALAEDLGTAFVVRAYPEDSTTTVVVTEGKVALRASDEGADRGAELTRGQLGQLDPSGVVNIVQHVDVERYLAWRQARLVFKRTPLAQVARELERWYDIDITLADSSLASVPVTGVFVSQPADRILRNVARSLDVKYTRQGREVRLRAH
jgi:Fe2+-dicitrate sensor, membrane component